MKCSYLALYLSVCTLRFVYYFLYLLPCDLYLELCSLYLVLCTLWFALGMSWLVACALYFVSCILYVNLPLAFIWRKHWELRPRFFRNFLGLTVSRFSEYFLAKIVILQTVIFCDCEWSTVFSWIAHGYPWLIHGLSMACPWTSRDWEKQPTHLGDRHILGEPVGR